MVGIHIGLPAPSQPEKPLAPLPPPPTAPLISPSPVPLLARKVKRPLFFVDDQSSENVVMDFPKIFFKTASAEIEPEVRAILAEAGIYLNSNNRSWKFLELIAHTDQRGNREYNIALSKRRATSVIEAMRLNDKSKNKMKISLFANKHLIGNKNEEKYWRNNRRVELAFRLKKASDSRHLIRILEKLIHKTEAIYKPFKNQPLLKNSPVTKKGQSDKKGIPAKSDIRKNRPSKLSPQKSNSQKAHRTDMGRDIGRPINRANDSVIR